MNKPFRATYDPNEMPDLPYMDTIHFDLSYTRRQKMEKAEKAAAAQRAQEAGEQAGSAPGQSPGLWGRDDKRKTAGGQAANQRRTLGEHAENRIGKLLPSKQLRPRIKKASEALRSGPPAAVVTLVSLVVALAIADIKHTARSRPPQAPGRLGLQAARQALGSAPACWAS